MYKDPKSHCPKLELSYVCYHFAGDEQVHPVPLGWYFSRDHAMYDETSQLFIVKS